MDTEWVGVQKKLSSCYLMLSQWHFHKFGTLAKSIKEVSEKLASLDDSDSSDNSVDHRCRLQRQLEDLLEKEELYWKQRS